MYREISTSSLGEKKLAVSQSVYMKLIFMSCMGVQTYLPKLRWWASNVQVVVPYEADSLKLTDCWLSFSLPLHLYDSFSYSGVLMFGSFCWWISHTAAYIYFYLFFCIFVLINSAALKILMVIAKIQMHVNNCYWDTHKNNHVNSCYC